MDARQHTGPAAELLAWYSEIGVDIAIDETAQDRFSEASDLNSGPAPETKRAMPPLPRFGAVPIAPAATQTQQAAVTDARERALAANTLDELRAVLDTYDGLSLRKTATRLVFADGNPNARVMFVGEAPGKDEDREGLPFVGRAGQLLDRMLAAIGLDRQQAYIANIIPWRPPGNRTPTPQEMELCLPFIRRQIELVNPDVLVLLGGSSSAALTGAKDGILKLRGRWLELDTGARTIKTLPTLHPAYLLRTPSQKKLAWRDFRALKAALDG